MKEGLRDFLLRLLYFFILSLVGFIFVFLPFANWTINKDVDYLTLYTSLYSSEGGIMSIVLALIFGVFLAVSSIKYWKGYIFGGILLLVYVLGDLIYGQDLAGLGIFYAAFMSPIILIFGYGIYFISTKYEKAKSDHKRYFLAIPFAIELILALLIFFI